jgi:hypothetical protein
MRRQRQLVVESAVIASVMIMLTLGGSVTTTIIPGSFLPLQNPSTVSVQYDLSGLARYYNTTLTEIGTGNFANASFLLDTFGFVNIPSNVNVTAQAANADLAGLNTTIPKVVGLFASARLAIKANQLINASDLVNTGCSLIPTANKSRTDFDGPQTSKFESESVPTNQYAPGQSLVSREIEALYGECSSLSAQVPGNTNTAGEPPVLTIGSTQRSIETGGQVELFGNLTKSGTGVAGQNVLFYINGSYFGTLATNSSGNLAGTVSIPFVYFNEAEVQALVAPNSTAGIGGAISNRIFFSILFSQTSIVIGDPPAYLPGAGFNVQGNLTTTNGVPLPDAPVTVTYLQDSVATFTDSSGTFGARFTVPDNATDGIYYVYAQFTPMGVYGPSFNFTSIEVHHLRLNLALAVPGFSWAGFSTSISGTATSNGTAVANATITLHSPWGSSAAETDGQGHFDLSFPVSPLEFAFSKNITVSASPSQPYIAGSTVVAALGLFNILLAILPAVVVGVGVYEANSLGAFQGIRERMGRRKDQSATLLTPLGGPGPEALRPFNTGPEPLLLFGRALALASARFSLVFKPSQTIREILAEVKAKDDGEAFVAFSKVLSVAEDFLYGRGFDPARTGEARTALTDLEVLWS